MHTLATYSFSRELPDHHSADEFLNGIRNEINSWLKTKNAHIKDGSSGDFKSKSPDGAGSLSCQSRMSSSGSYEKVELEEFFEDSEIFSTSVYTAISDKNVFFYCSLQVEGLESGISRPKGIPKCPSIVRRVAQLSPEWTLNGNRIPGPLEEVNTEADGVVLASEIASMDRRIPIVLIAKTEEGNEVWPNTGADLAYELFGLARVVVASDKATYGLSDQELCANSIDCYDGAIRLYWPRTGKIVPSQLWTERQLLARDRDGRGKNRIKRDIKELIMSAATVSNPRPSLISKIDNEAAADHIASLEETSGQAAALSEKVKTLDRQIEDLTNRLVESERLVIQLSAKLRYQSTYQAPPLVDEADGANDESYHPPAAGEIRFYKKIADKGNHDLLRRFKDCGHTSWQNSAGADKAKKGLEKLEGRNDWKNVWHCGSCTGGGVWKVRW